MNNPKPIAPESAEPRFWSYLKEKELSYFPTGALRWWILSIIVFAWTIEQFERL